jgi:catechol 2,3-dioxygenase-like lactoylglutathione lyase family enzyme
MGDDACHLSGTCLSCGRFLDVARPTTDRCPHCGAGPDGAPAATDAVVEARAVNTILYCRAWPDTVDFYRRVLGLTATYSTDWFVEFRITHDAFVSVADASRATIEAGGGRGLTVSIRVDDLAGVRSRIESRGGTPTSVDRRFGAEVFDVHDPEGNRIEFWQE